MIVSPAPATRRVRTFNLPVNYWPTIAGNSAIRLEYDHPECAEWPFGCVKWR